VAGHPVKWFVDNHVIDVSMKYCQIWIFATVWHGWFCLSLKVFKRFSRHICSCTPTMMILRLTINPAYHCHISV
jgi:hypothetical protein